MTYNTEALKHRTRDLSIAQGALHTIGDILWRRQVSADLDNLETGDIEGLSMAVIAISELIANIVTDFDEALDNLSGPRFGLVGRHNLPDEPFDPASQQGGAA